MCARVRSPAQAHDSAARVRVPVGSAESPEGGNEVHAAVVGHLQERDPRTRPLLKIRPRPSRSHWMVEPAENMLPSSA